MGLYEFHQCGALPEVPVRRKEDVLQIVKRWEDGPDEGLLVGDEWIDWDTLEQDMHALAAVAMEALPD
ncbi:MAG: hypothetical protein ACR2RF_26200 [Geminicoccaceae bacterium]